MITEWIAMCQRNRDDSAGAPLAIHWREMIYIIVIGIVVAALVGVAKPASSERCAKMTEEEFEAEARTPRAWAVSCWKYKG